MSIRAKLAFGFLSTALAAAALVAVNYLKLHEDSLSEAENESIERIAQDARRLEEEAEFSRDPLMLIDGLKALLANRPELAYFELTRNGATTRVEPRPKRAAADVFIKSVSTDKGSITIAFSNSYLQAKRRTAGEMALRNMQKSLYTVLPFALLLALVLSLSLSRRIGSLGKTLEAIGEGKFGVTTSVKGQDEIGRLASNINVMSQKLQELEAMKKTFIASVTHELRSPLASIESCVRLILSENEGRSQTELDMLRRIQSNATRLGHFVTNVLEMAKIERGKLDMHAQATNVKALIEDAVLFFEPKAKEAGISLQLLSNGDLPPAMKLDPDLITQVIANLVSNAIKFTPRGGSITVEAHRKDTEGRKFIECSVRDSGVGIPQDALSRIFAPFQRVPNQLKASGSGLGLAISKSIIELHEGRIGVESDAGKGSRFFFLLPLK